MGYWLVPSLFYQVFGATQREGRDGGRRIHAAGGRPDAAIKDVKIGNVMAAAPGIHDRSGRIKAHSGSAEQMPARLADERRDDGLVRSSGLQRFASALQMKFEQPARIIGHAIDELWRRNTIGILQVRIEDDTIV